jgi:hypothetical protein
MAVISIPGQEPQKLQNQTLRILCESAKEHLADGDDRYLLDQAGALNGLHFELVEPGRRGRLASALIAAADAYHADLLARAEPDELESSRAQVLGELSSYLKPVAAQK